MVRWLGIAVVTMQLVGCQYAGPPPSGLDGRGGESAGDFTGGGINGGGDGGTIEPGTLTAGAWDDNENFDFYLSYLAGHAALQGAPPIGRGDRHIVTVRDRDGDLLAGATVRIEPLSGGPAFVAPTAADGRVFYFPAWYGASGDLRATATFGNATATATFSSATPASDLTLDVDAAAVHALDVALVIDTTGSMGDEMEYMKVELDAIAEQVRLRHEGVDQRWALIVYRDVGDEYVVRTFDFTTVDVLRAHLAAQSADGGNDLPEAVVDALDATASLSWRGGAVARMAFHIADAPHHVGQEAGIATALKALRQRGVHVYPVAASGTDELAEFTFRTEAQVTGGRYLFLTDDSGVGGSHMEPSIPCYFVTKLDGAMRRMVSIELTGHYVQPEQGEILRTGGDPQDRLCKLEGGKEVIAL